MPRRTSTKKESTKAKAKLIDTCVAYIGGERTWITKTFESSEGDEYTIVNKNIISSNLLMNEQAHQETRDKPTHLLYAKFYDSDKDES